MNATQQIIGRLNAIESKLDRQNNVYEHASRHSEEHTMAFTAMHNLESERDMLEAALTGLKITHAKQ